LEAQLIKKSNVMDMAAALGGLPVLGCLPGSPVDKAGIKYGDVLLSVDGQLTPSWDAYIAARESSGPSIRLRLSRDGREFEVDVVLERDGAGTLSTLTASLGLLDGPPDAAPKGRPN
jgi:S1-C subfamily serine protease